MPEFEDDHETGEVACGVRGRAVFRCVLDQLKLEIIINHHQNHRQDRHDHHSSPAATATAQRQEVDLRRETTQRPNRPLCGTLRHYDGHDDDYGDDDDDNGDDNDDIDEDSQLSMDMWQFCSSCGYRANFIEQERSRVNLRRNGHSVKA